MTSIRPIPRLVTIKNNLRTFLGFGDFARGYLRFTRFSTLMAANWPLMSVNVFFVGYGAQFPLMVWPQRSCGNGRKWRAAHAVGHVA